MCYGVQSAGICVSRRAREDPLLAKIEELPHVAEFLVTLL